MKIESKENLLIKEHYRGESILDIDRPFSKQPGNMSSGVVKIRS